VKRHLAAIMAADVVGYSRLMGEDETATLAALRWFRRTAFEPAVEEFGGNIIKRMGDGWIVEFSDVLSAVHCAIRIQVKLVDHEAVRLRIGVHIGDIVFEDEDVYGDGINIAARLEAKAEPGSVLISDTAHDSLDGKAASQFTEGGSQYFKNIARPVAVWCWPDSAVISADDPANEKDSKSGGFDKPVIVVLPLANISGDSEQEFFADGISEDIITSLSRFPDLAVIARGTCFSYKGKSVKAQALARELGARYVLEGSVRRGSGRVRISVQLVDAKSGSQIWADRFDRNLVDFFDLQDEITAQVVASVPGRLARRESDRVRNITPSEMSAYDCVIRGKQLHHSSTPEDNAEAVRLFDKAIEIDPHYAPAYAWKACTLGQAIALGCGGNPRDLLKQVFECAHGGLSLDAQDVECNRILCEFSMERGEWDEAERFHEIAYSLNSNDPRIVAQRGELYTKLGLAEEGILWVKKAMELDPLSAGTWAHLRARAHFAAKDYREALASYNRINRPSAEHFAEMAACFAKIDRRDKADSFIGQALSKRPDYNIGAHLRRFSFKQTEDVEHLQQVLAATNLPQ